jgi:NTF2 fold immunity protein of polymorphic toxin system component
MMMMMTGGKLESLLLRRHIKAWLLAVTMFAVLGNVSRADEHSYVPTNGFVPDVATAIAIAEAILVPIYGRAQVEAERPFSASSDGNIWTVLGHLESGHAGGVATVVIGRATARVIRVAHGR